MLYKVILLFYFPDINLPLLCGIYPEEICSTHICMIFALACNIGLKSLLQQGIS